MGFGDVEVVDGVFGGFEGFGGTDGLGDAAGEDFLLPARFFGHEPFVGGFFTEATEAVGDYLGIESGACGA